jgi:formylglycine-generating enzyme required for sulfatase activity
MKLVPIQPDTFTMGQDRPPTEDYLRQKRFGEMRKDFDRIDFDEKPAHKVTITQPFLMGVTEVTVTQFRQFDPEFKKKDPKSKPADDDAARGVTWERAVAVREWRAFVFWALTGRTRNSRFPPLSGVFVASAWRLSESGGPAA